MSEQGAQQEPENKQAATKPTPKAPPKKRKSEPEVTIAPSGGGGPDVSIE